jgi:hypothetical protein
MALASQILGATENQVSVLAYVNVLQYLRVCAFLDCYDGSNYQTPQDGRKWRARVWF